MHSPRIHSNTHTHTHTLTPTQIYRDISVVSVLCRVKVIVSCRGVLNYNWSHPAWVQGQLSRK